MAKAKEMEKMPSGGKCKCNWGLTIVGLILAVIAVYLFGAGLDAQLSASGMSWSALGWYLLSLIVMLIAKMTLWKGWLCCPVHGWGG